MCRYTNLYHYCINTVDLTSLADHPRIIVSTPTKKKKKKKDVVLTSFLSLFIVNQVVNQMLKSSNPDINLHHHVAKVRKTLDERLHKGMWEMIQQELVPLGCNALKPIGGYFIWLQLPSGIVCDDVQQVIRDHNIDISFGNTALFMVPNGDNEDDESYIRLCFAHYDTETLQAGIQRLAQAIRLSSTQSQDPNTWTLLPKGGKSSPNGTTSTTLNQQNPI
ncbi:hypothetical protein BC941DRAFT_200843 [Chlamydoabsidia padenii]|nr:hypothetical protein BC941DRAFT_200843 [Chlamydoabsidia padenii]